MSQDEKKGLSFIVAAYNEEGSIYKMLHRLSGVLASLDLPTEIILVNDGSTDATSAEAARVQGVRIINQPVNVGYGTSLKIGLLSAKYDWAGIVDGDDSYPVEEIPVLLKEMEKGYDMVVAKRNNLREIDSLVKYITRWFFIKIVQLLNDTRIEDPNSGFRIMKREIVVRLFPFLCGGFSFTTSLTILLSGLSFCVSYMPVRYSKRKGHTKVRHIRDSARTVQYVMEGIIFFNPIKFFLILSLFLGFFVFLPGGCLLLISHPTLAFYYVLCGTGVVFLIGLGALGEIVRTSVGRRFHVLH